MAVQCDPSHAFLQLPRGGICIRRQGTDDPSDPKYLNLQIGSPPETLKDTLNNSAWPPGVPRDFVVPERLVDPRSIVTLAELEFTGYYHFFVRPEKQPTRIYLNNPVQTDQVTLMLKEAIFGARTELEEFRADFARPEEAFDIKAECGYFNPFSFEDVFQIHTRMADEKRILLPNGYSMAVLKSGGIFYYKLYEPNNAQAVFTCSEVDLFSRKRAIEKKSAMVRRPDFAIAAIGNSTGFDEQGETSGFLLWIGGNGLMIDPPANTRFWLMENRVLAEETDRVILTHCHADHDAGLLQRMLENDHLDVYTTRTIWNSFMRKYGPLLEEFQPSYHWHEIKIGQPVKILGADFDFFYSLHSVPTIAFTVRYRDVNVFYSSDMRFSRKTYDEMRAAGTLAERRFEFFTGRYPRLMDGAQFILHEAGGDPLHTTLEELNALDLATKRKTFVYHLSEAEYEVGRKAGINDFSLITVGMNQQDIKVFSSEESMPAAPDESFLKYCPLFFEMKMRDVKELINACEIKKIPRGQVFLQRGAKAAAGDSNGFVYLIYSGIVGVLNEQGQKIKEYHKFDFVGESGVLLEKERNADVVALEDTRAYAIPSARFRELMKPYDGLFARLEQNRGQGVETALSRSYFTSTLSWRARTDLQLIGRLKRYDKGKVIMGREDERYLIIIDGKVKAKRAGQEIEYPITLGNQLEIDHVGLPDEAGAWDMESVIAVESTQVLEVRKSDYIGYSRRHGALRWRWQYLKSYFQSYVLGQT